MFITNEEPKECLLPSLQLKVFRPLPKLQSRIGANIFDVADEIQLIPNKLLGILSRATAFLIIAPGWLSRKDSVR